LYLSPPQKRKRGWKWFQELFLQLEPIPYALAVTLEVAKPLAISVYEEVRVALDRIRTGTRVRPRIRGDRPE
jgi:hypothetical protein